MSQWKARKVVIVGYADANAVVITAGSKQRPGGSHLDLPQRNAAIIETIVDELG